jgi:hypothetical protein
MRSFYVCNKKNYVLHLSVTPVTEKYHALYLLLRP